MRGIAQVNAGRPVIPPPASSIAASCRDPGVDEDAMKALAENRYALAECSRKHRGLLAWSDAVQKNYGAPAPK